MHEKRVYSIIATYNGMQWIEKCLKSLADSNQQNHIVVIDNGSKDNTVAFIKVNFPLVELIETGKNLGFGQANNIGLKLALQNKADYAFLLNQDAWVEKDTISKLIQAHTDNPSSGIISPVHLNGAGDKLDPVFYDYFIKSDIKEFITNTITKKESFYPVVNTSFVNAAAWLVSGDCLKKTGGFDPVFFHYGEDDNYAHRVLYKGFKIAILCNTNIYHDKEYTVSNKSLNINSLFKHDWIIFLHQACDIQNPKYKSLMIRRFCRYSLLSVLSLITLNKNALLYNFLMIKNIPGSFFKIKKSRHITVNDNSPYLV